MDFREFKSRIRRAGSRAELLPLVTNGLTDYFDADACAVFAGKEDSPIEIGLSTRKSGKYRQFAFTPQNENVVVKAYRTARPLNLPAAGAESLRDIPLLEEYAGSPLIALPLRSDDAVNGVTLIIKDAARGGFSPEEEAECLALADEISAALAAIGAREDVVAERDRLRWENERLHAAVGSAPIFAAAGTPAASLEQLLEEVRRGVPSDRGAVYRYDDTSGAVEQVAVFGYSPEEARLVAETFADSIAHEAMHKAQPVRVADVSTGAAGRMTEEAAGGGSLLAVPVLLGDEAVGVVCLGSDTPNAFEAEDIFFVDSLAACAAAAYGLSRRLEAETKLSRQFTLINEIGKKAFLAPSTRELYKEIAEAIRSNFDYYSVMLFSVDAGRRELYLEAIVGGYASHLPIGHRQRLEDGLIGAAVREKNTIFVNDTTQDGRFFATTLPSRETKSEICVPVLKRGEVAAVIDVQSRRLHAFGESDVLMLETLTDQIGVTLENSELLREERKRARELAMIGGIGREILASRDISSLLKSAAAAIRNHFKYYNVAVFLVNPDDPETLNAAVIEGAYEKALQDWTLPHVTAGVGLVGWAAAEGKVVLSNDAFKDERYTPDPIPGEQRSELCIPIKIGDVVAGVLDVQENETGALSETDVEILQTFADQLALAIQNVSLLAKEQDATSDAQTLLHISHIISQTVDLDQSLEFLVEETNTVMDSDATALFLVDDEDEPRKFMAAAGLPAETENALRSGEFSFGRYNLYEDAKASTKPLFIFDVAALDEELRDSLFPGVTVGALALAPLRKKGRLLGLLFTLWEAPEPGVSDSDRALFEGVAFQAAIGVENLLYLENVRRQTDYLSILSSIAADASRLPPLVELLRAAIEKILAFAGFDAGAIHLYEERRRSFHLVAQVALDEKKIRAWEDFESIEGERATALTDPTELFAVAGPGEKGPFDFPPEEEGGPTGYVSVPLTAKQQTLGRLTLFSWKGKTARAEDTSLLRTICDQLSIFIENTRLLARNTSRMEELLTLLETSKTLSSSLDTEEIIYNIAQKVKDLIGGDNCTIFLLDRDAGVLEPIVSLTAYPEEVMKIRLKLGEGITGHVALTGVGEYVNDAVTDERVMTVPGTPADEREALLCVPLLSREETIGVMTLGRLGGDYFTDSDLQLLTLFAGQVAGSIENARLFDRVLSSVSTAEEHRRKLDATFASIADAIIVTDTGLRVIEVNPAAEKMLGRKAREVVNRHVRSVIETPTLHETFEQATVRLREHDAAEFEFVVDATDGDGATGYYRVLVNAVTSPTGEKVGFVATFRDVTEAKELTLLKENFIANVSHELRTPLTSIIGSSELIMADERSGEYPYYQFVSIIDKEARRLRELVDSILDFSLLESRELELRVEATKVNEIVEEVIAKYEKLAQTSGISLEFEAGESIPVTYADPGLIATALGNLVKNAVQFNSSGGHVRVSSKVQGSEIAVAVADDGPGIPEDHMNSIFSTFYQVDGSSTRTVGGTGLGLTIARRAAEAHGGRILAASTVGEGSTFTFLIPLQREPGPKKPRK
jgi:two-component system phosphate regulon sensor histidine kinase PhoR